MPDVRDPLTIRPAMFPMPANTTEHADVSIWTTVTAAPRVPASCWWAACKIVLRLRNGEVRNSFTAACDAFAASTPCPRPSATMMLTQSRASSAVPQSPQTVSSVIGLDEPSTYGVGAVAEFQPNDAATVTVP